MLQTGDVAGGRLRKVSHFSHIGFPSSAKSYAPLPSGSISGTGGGGGPNSPISDLHRGLRGARLQQPRQERCRMEFNMAARPPRVTITRYLNLQMSYVTTYKCVYSIPAADICLFPSCRCATNRGCGTCMYMSRVYSTTSMRVHA